jgi:hypothetical protein
MPNDVFMDSAENDNFQVMWIKPSVTNL